MDAGFWLSVTLTNLAPITEQTSIHPLLPLLAASAWEIDGASDASKIAKHAIHAVNLRVSIEIFIVE